MSREQKKDSQAHATRTHLLARQKADVRLHTGCVQVGLVHVKHAHAVVPLRVVVAAKARVLRKAERHDLARGGRLAAWCAPLGVAGEKATNARR